MWQQKAEEGGAENLKRLSDQCSRINPCLLFLLPYIQTHLIKYAKIQTACLQTNAKGGLYNCKKNVLLGWLARLGWIVASEDMVYLRLCQEHSLY